MASGRMHRRDFLRLSGVALAGAVLSSRANVARAASEKPNFIIIFCDDMGYGDIGCFGATRQRTPHLDRMAAEGRCFTSFYVTSGLCTPSRSSLMTGCYPRRVNMHEDGEGGAVLFPIGAKGLGPDEITIAEMLKEQGYATGCIGKWHLGDQPEFLPTRQGFDYYLGIPYSNDMGDRKGTDWPPLPLLRNETVIEAPVDQDTLTQRYTVEAVRFIEENKDGPFFLYLPHTMVHLPWHVSDGFRDKSNNGIYGDAVEEIDWSTGQILAALKRNGLDEKTLVVFTSDNGAIGGKAPSNGPLRGTKGTVWEGGMREPCVVRWPGHVPAGTTCDELSTTMDLFPTFAALAGGRVPTDRIIDGKDIRPLMLGYEGAMTPHEVFYYYRVDQLQAIRSGKWKLHLPLNPQRKNFSIGAATSPLQLYDLQADIGERHNVAMEHPLVVRKLLNMAEIARQDLGDLGRPGKHNRPAAFVKDPKPWLMPTKNTPSETAP